VATTRGFYTEGTQFRLTDTLVIEREHDEVSLIKIRDYTGALLARGAEIGPNWMSGFMNRPEVTTIRDEANSQKRLDAAGRLLDETYVTPHIFRTTQDRILDVTAFVHAIRNLQAA
jgi:hypothetical protein